MTMITNIELTDYERDCTKGSSFWLGPILDAFEVGGYQFIKYNAYHFSGRKKMLTDKVLYCTYINERSTNHSYPSLDRALVGVIAYHNEGPNSKAADYFNLMIGIENQEETVDVNSN